MADILKQFTKNLQKMDEAKRYLCSFEGKAASMKHEDKSGITSIDWAALAQSLPPAARAAFDERRKYRQEQSARLLEAYAKGEGGLTTYDPDHAGWIKGELGSLASFGECVERGEMYERERRLGVVDAAKSLTS